MKRTITTIATGSAICGALILSGATSAQAARPDDRGPQAPVTATVRGEDGAEEQELPVTVAATSRASLSLKHRSMLLIFVRRMLRSAVNTRENLKFYMTISDSKTQVF